MTNSIIRFRSWAFFSINFVFSFFYGLFALLCWVLVSSSMGIIPKRHLVKLSYYWTLIARFLLRWICGVRIKVEGGENIDITKPYIMFARHESALETIVFSSLFGTKNLAFVFKKEILDIPFFGMCLKTSLPIPIDRSKGSGAIRQMMVEVADRLSNNLNVVIFPEGTRTPHDKPGSIGKGSVLMAKKNDTNVYLVSLDTGKLWKPKGIFIKSGLVTIKVSKNKHFYQKDINESIEEISNYFHSNI